MANFNLNDYETVDSRIKRFYLDHPEGRILTELVDFSGLAGSTRWTIQAFVYRSLAESAPSATGYAFEVDGQGMANKTSALENCETSAIGRALANLGYSGDKRASREEVQKDRIPVVPPDGWQKLINDSTTVPQLTKIYETATKDGWFITEVKELLGKRKAEVSA